jgi:predicted DNA-binding protein
MNRKVKEYDSVVSLRLARRDREDLERLCSALGVTKSEFVRKRIEILNNTIQVSLLITN